MELFSEKLQSFLDDFGKGRKMVLSTSENYRVSSRMMSVVMINAAHANAIKVRFED